MAIRISPDIAGIVPYSPGKPIEEVERELGITGSIKLASNENPRGPSPKALAVLAEAAKTVNRYPDGGGYYLRVSRWRGLQPARRPGGAVEGDAQPDHPRQRV